MSDQSVSPADGYLGLRALAAYSSIAVRVLRAWLKDPAHPLRCYRVGGRILVRRSEFDEWVKAFQEPAPEGDAVVEKILAGLDGSGRHEHAHGTRGKGR